MSSPKSLDGNPLLKSVMDSMAADGEAVFQGAVRCRQEMEGMVAPNPQTADDLKAHSRASIEWHGAVGRGGPPSLIPGRGAFNKPELQRQGSGFG